jgi:membrane-associated phospholipid phosphatase
MSNDEQQQQGLNLNQEEGDGAPASVAASDDDDDSAKKQRGGDNGGGFAWEHAGWILWGIFCALLGWVFTDMLPIDDETLDIPVQQVLVTDDVMDEDNADGRPFSFFIRDSTFDEHHDDNNGDTVSTIATYVLAGLLPLVLQAALASTFGPRRDLHHTVVGYLVTFGTSLLFSEPVKWYVSYRRPNFYQVCEPNADYSACENFFSDGNDDHENPREAIFSFPSGHSSTAFAGLTFFTLYLHYRFGMPAWHRRVRRQRKKIMLLLQRRRQQQQHDDNFADYAAAEFDNDPTNNKSNKPNPAASATSSSISSSLLNNRTAAARHRCISYFAFLFPQGLAVFISVSRIVDARHFPADVIAGALVGMASAVWVHPMWYYYYHDENGSDDDDDDHYHDDEY